MTHFMLIAFQRGTQRSLLTKEEITMQINETFKKVISGRFIFCRFSGLSWSDMYNLTPIICRHRLMYIYG